MTLVRQRRSWLLDHLGARSSRWLLNLWPALRGCGVRVTYLAPDWSELRIELPLNWRTRNAVGTIFGGSIYAAADPFLLLLLLRRLGPEYVAWVKHGSVHFRRPGVSRLQAEFRFTAEDEAEIRAALRKGGTVELERTTELRDRSGDVRASVTTRIHVARSR